MPDAPAADEKPAKPDAKTETNAEAEKTAATAAEDVQAAQERLAAQQEAERKAAAQKALDRQYLEAAKKGNLKELKALLQKGAALMAHDDGNTALFYAAQFGRMDTVLFLLKQGIPLDVKNRIGSTPLTGAAAQGHQEVAKLLYDLGSDPALKNFTGSSAFSYARCAGYTDMIDLLSKPRQADEVTLTRDAGGLVLEETFNFAHRDRLTVVRRAQGGPVEAIQRDSFADLSDKAALRKAFAFYAQRGGTIPESEIFPAPPAAEPEKPAPKKPWRPWRRG